MTGDDAENGGAGNDDTAGGDAADGGPPATEDVVVREATREDRPAVLNVLDAAMLDTEGVEASLANGDALVAVEEDRVLGALALVDVDEGTSPGERNPASSVHGDGEPPSSEREAARLVHAVAVRRARRGQGIGSALVVAAAERTDLVAEFDGRNRPFYRSLGFEIERIGPDRFRGRRRSDP